MTARVVAQLLHRRAADTACRHVHHALETAVVVTVVQQPQVGKRVLDLLAFEEAQAAVDAVRHARTDQRLFEHARLRAHAVQHGGIVVAVAAIHVLADAVDDELRLVVLVVGRIELHRLAGAGVRPQLLAEPRGIARDQAIGSVEDRAGGSVVLLQPHDLAAGKIRRQPHHVLDAGTAPGVHALVVITHREQHTRRSGQCAQPAVLQRVGVLELVDEDVAEAAPVVHLDLLHVARQLVGAQQQLGKVDHALTLAGRLVGGVDAHELALRVVAFVGEVLRSARLLLLRIDPARHGLRRPLVVRQVQSLEHALDQSYLVVGVENLEVLRQIGFAIVHAQHAMRDAVERAHPHRPDRHIHQLLDARTHLRRRLVGEGDRENRQRRDALRRNQPGHAVRQHPRLAGPGPGEHQPVLRRRHHGVTLGGIERGDEGGGIERGETHRAILTAGGCGPPDTHNDRIVYSFNASGSCRTRDLRDWRLTLTWSNACEVQGRFRRRRGCPLEPVVVVSTLRARAVSCFGFSSRSALITYRM